MRPTRAGLLILAFAPLLAACAPARAEPRADGVFNEWDASHLLAPEAGGVAGAFNTTAVYATSRGSVLFLRFDTGVVLNLQAGQAFDGFPVLTIDRLDDGQRSPLLEIDFRNRSVERVDGGGFASWRSLDLEILPTFAADEYELTLDLATLGVGVGDEIAITLGDGSPGEDAAAFTLAEPSASLPERSADRGPRTDLRVASLNTLRTGTLDFFQADRLARLLDAVDPDVICLQEEYNSSAAQVRAFVEQADPREDGAAWNVTKNNDCVVASPHPLVPIPENSSKYAAAIVEAPSGAVAVFTNHPKCCGHIGSSEDAQRIGEMNDLIAVIDALRTGALGAALVPHADAPVVLIGDWNLVGSRVPLDLVEDPAGPALREVYLEPLAGNSVATWRGGSSGPGSFMPGRLDLLAVQRAGLEVRSAFVLDSARLSGPTLATLGLQPNDSDGSDHLLLVADLEILCPGDVNGDKVVDVFDFGDLAAGFGAGPDAPRSAGDLNADGAVDVFDFAELADLFGEACGP
jgi:endonuclease/exonuclease/phosphatase family metal-dependent hydrolase